MPSPPAGPDPTDATVSRLVELACHAPSIANSQPWTWRARGGALELLADHTRRLDHDDPAGRQLMISCGAALHHLRVAAGALGVEARVTLVEPEPGAVLELLARIDLSGDVVGRAGPLDLHLLHARHTDRHRFTSWPIPPDRLRSLARAARRPGVEALPVDGAGHKTELGVLLHESALVQSTLSSCDGVVAGRAERDPEAQIERDDGILVLVSACDAPPTWLSVGESLSALWLEATRQGLAVVPLSSPIESPSARALVRRALPARAGLPHLVLRITWGALGRSHLAARTRRPLEEVLHARGDEGPTRSMSSASPGRASAGAE